MRNDHRDSSPASAQPSPKKISDIMLERFLLGELPAREKAALQHRLATDLELNARLDTLRSADEAFARTHDVHVLAHGVRERVRRDKVESDIRRSASRPASGFAGWKPALGGVFLIALVAVPAWRVLNGESSTMVANEIVPERREAATSGIESETVASDDALRPKTPEGNSLTTLPQVYETPKPAPEIRTKSDEGASAPTVAATERVKPDPRDQFAARDEDVTRLKGLEPGIALFRRTLAGAEPLQPGARVKPGDVIRIGYRAGGKAFGAIFSVDGYGNVTRHWPTSGDRATRLDRGEALLPGAFELDAAPDYERFYFITAESAFTLKPVLESLHADTLSPTGEISVVRFELLKENGI